MLILIDNGHGLDTPGKRSPDGRFLEAIYNREIARRIVAYLTDRGYNAELLVPEPEDIPLSERVCRINAHCNTLGKSNVIVISIHVNAAGWSCYTSKGQTTSDLIAECFYTAAKKNFPGKRIRTDFSDSDPDWKENFYILCHSLCPAVLTENFFMDNLSDLEYLQSRVGKQAVVDTHIEGILEYVGIP